MRTNRWPHESETEGPARVPQVPLPPGEDEDEERLEEIASRLREIEAILRRILEVLEAR